MKKTAIILLAGMFGAGSAMAGGHAGGGATVDTSDNGEVNIVDAVMTLDTLFIGKAVVPAPGMDECGVDPTKDALGCAAYEACD